MKEIHVPERHRTIAQWRRLIARIRSYPEGAYAVIPDAEDGALRLAKLCGAKPVRRMLIGHGCRGAVWVLEPHD